MVTNLERVIYCEENVTSKVRLLFPFSTFLCEWNSQMRLSGDGERFPLR